MPTKCLAKFSAPLRFSHGDPPLERSALSDFLGRPAPQRPSVAIPARPEAMAAHMKAEAVAAAKKAAAEREAEKLRTYERERKQRWRAACRAKGLPTHNAAAARARRVRRKAAAEAWRDGAGIAPGRARRPPQPLFEMKAESAIEASPAAAGHEVDDRV